MLPFMHCFWNIDHHYRRNYHIAVLHSDHFIVFQNVIPLI